MAAISSLAAEAHSIVTVLLFSFWRKQGTTASSTISIWRLARGSRHTYDDRRTLQRSFRCRKRTELIPSEGLGGVGDHGHTQLDGLADGEGQVLVTITEICNKEVTALKYQRGLEGFLSSLDVTHRESVEVSQPSPAPERPGRPGFRSPGTPAGQTDTGPTPLWTDQCWCWSEIRDRQVNTPDFSVGYKNTCV